MFRSGLVILFMLFPMFCVADQTEDQLKTFIQSRVVLGQVYFAPAAAQLSQKAVETLDRIAPVLNEKNADHLLFRVEGFSSPDGNSKDNVSLSMSRALSVRNYLSEKHQLNVEVFLTGFGPADTAVSHEESRRVDITMYNQPVAAQALFDDQGTVDRIVLK